MTDEKKALIEKLAEAASYAEQEFNALGHCNCQGLEPYELAKLDAAYAVARAKTIEARRELNLAIFNLTTPDSMQEQA